jgi:Protein of unknown function DUF47
LRIFADYQQPRCSQADAVLVLGQSWGFGTARVEMSCLAGFRLSSIGSNAGLLNTLTTKIITLEEEADDICNRGLKALYLANRQDANRGNAMKFIIGSEVYDHLEKVVDRFEDVANKISSIVVDQL